MSFKTFLHSAAVITAFVHPATAADLMSFWDSPVKGGNVFNAAPKEEAYFRALVDTGATWVRLTFSKWEGQERDFLIGDADDYDSLIPEDLAVLRAELDAAHAVGLKVVIAPLTLPGSRWSQQNGGEFDDRLWEDSAYQDQAAQFWADLATALKDHPAIAAYNILNEPAPEKMAGGVENGSDQALHDWQNAQAGGTRDLTAFYDKVIAGIREVDLLTPVMVDGGWFANPRSLAAWPRALSDDRVLYAFHMYEPYAATSAPNMKRDVPLRYPGVVTEYAGGEESWNRQAVASHIGAAFNWAEQQGLPPTRVVAAEFGCMRRWADCGKYLTDVMDAVEERGGHWAFYSFREDEWEGMDYELPTSVAPGQFYWLTEEGKDANLPRDGELMDLLRDRMRS
ncbi:glycoside hydrolase family 5 protein [Nitratireductor sp. L1-7-SE]|uniref:Glycoside hydrolase family 5 protein n=1 Tax=Nitratireductor rhodophyticola TaxID=2854036 RepID=A0ABS7RA15_9HYPH|nr:cellulase family glycosylhydrolase [Nitratireductor rhodophyticola]MBY8917230.1 glycoside hydrolase family 5 protein [Nitratireductor rhodophyticola]MBY8920341.1 glycoside hydrolase family 5 protein [Nitratireductor rhodophyticola]